MPHTGFVFVFGLNFASLSISPSLFLSLSFRSSPRFFPLSLPFFFFSSLTLSFSHTLFYTHSSLSQPSLPFTTFLLLPFITSLLPLRSLSSLALFLSIYLSPSISPSSLCLSLPPSQFLFTIRFCSRLFLFRSLICLSLKHTQANTHQRPSVFVPQRLVFVGARALAATGLAACCRGPPPQHLRH